MSECSCWQCWSDDNPTVTDKTCTYCGVEITFIGEHNCYQKRVAALEEENARLKAALSEYVRNDKARGVT